MKKKQSTILLRFVSVAFSWSERFTKCSYDTVQTILRILPGFSLPSDRTVKVMITYDQAWILAKDHIKPQEESLRKIEPDDGLVLGKSVEFDEGWLFYFTSRKYLETRNIFYRPIGAGPVIVGRENGDVYQGGSGYTEEEWINEFRDYLRSRRQPKK